jgi:hypothetical protein
MVNVTVLGSTYTFCTFAGDLGAGEIAVCDPATTSYKYTYTYNLINDSSPGTPVDSVNAQTVCSFSDNDYGDSCARYRDGSNYPTDGWYIDSSGGTKDSANNIPEFKDVIIPLIGMIIIVLFIRKKKLGVVKPTKSK